MTSREAFSVTLGVLAGLVFCVLYVAAQSCEPDTDYSVVPTFKWQYPAGTSTIDGFEIQWRHYGEGQGNPEAAWRPGRAWSAREQRYITRMYCWTNADEEPPVRLCPGVDMDVPIDRWIHPESGNPVEVEFRIRAYKVGEDPYPWTEPERLCVP